MRFLGYDITVWETERVIKADIQGQHTKKRSLKGAILYRTLLQVLLQGTLKRLTHRILSLESATNPEGAGDE
jgi:hypothetical protein